MTYSTSHEPRIAPISEDDAGALREDLAKTTAPGARPNNLFLTLAHHPALMKRHNVLGGAFRQRSTLTVEDRETTVLRIAVRTSSVYEFAKHAVIATGAGMDAAVVENIGRAVNGSEIDDPKAALLVEMVDQLYEKDTVADHTFARLLQEFDRAQVLELIALVGFYRMTAGILNSAGVRLEESTPAWAAGLARDVIADAQSRAVTV
ncbi:Alkylhydroperoxidase family enzyme, contains CxxC motif [Sinosporangium album]|uniref:Alkylhydroperoxidase family enzyme, contains CxxC motif n=1 Tax=Sinosporangium album TaxID=504805 RepID=A0A1G8FRG9_9ACTN|nr:hypothetical protein [Sinosporangium album]SDH84536.1 Alkylhydroperoxidase family enzyme, contains CxxC motif [Sinosporangium album]